MSNFPESRDSLLGSLRRGTLEETDDSGTQQVLKRLRGLASERPERVMRIQSHGITSHPPAGSEGLFLALGGRSDRLVGLGFEHPDHRPKGLPAGGTAIYDAFGKVLKFVPDETDLDAGGKPVTVRNASTVTIEASATIVIKAAEDVAIGVAGRFVRIRPGRVDLGVAAPDAEAPVRVMTEAGPSQRLYGVVE